MSALLKVRVLSAAAVTMSAIAAIGLLSSGPGSAATASPGSAATVSSVNILNYHDSYCIDAASESYPSNGDIIHLWTCNSNPEQLWHSTSNNQIENKTAGWCLDAASESGLFPYNGDPLQLWTCNTHAEQEWGARPEIYNGRTWWEIYNLAHPGYCVDVDTSSTTGAYPSNGDFMQLWKCNDVPPQLWYSPSLP